MTRDRDQMPSQTLERGVRIGAVSSSYHGELTAQMLASARAELLAAGLAAEDLLVAEAPGTFEIPLLARALALREGVAAVMCFGLVLKGETSHDFHIASSVSHALQDVALSTDKPILFGVLTCDTLEQAQARALPAAQGGELDKGREVARAVVAALASRKAIDAIGGVRRAGFFTPFGEGPK